MSEQLVDPRFRALATRFRAMFTTSAHGGGALAVYLHGEPVLDIWAGNARRGRPWQADTVALSFSTGKGVASTVLHRLADQGLLDYDAPVAQYWPEFAAEGKERITVRELMSHRAGLHRAYGLAPDGLGLLDYDRMVTALAATAPDPRRLIGPGYHGVTYGWLAAELASRVAGRPFTDVLRTELAEPLGTDALWFEVPKSEQHRIAGTFPRILPRVVPWALVSGRLAGIGPTRGFAEAMMPEKFDELVRMPAVHDAVMPGWNGVFTARALAKMYAPIAYDGTVEGTRLFSAERVREMGRVQTRQRDYVLGLRPNWRLGYHQVIVPGRGQTGRAFGHYGLGGSGAYADPDIGLSLAFVANRLGNRVSSMYALRLPRLGALARNLALAAGAQRDFRKVPAS